MDEKERSNFRAWIDGTVCASCNTYINASCHKVYEIWDAGLKLPKTCQHFKCNKRIRFLLATKLRKAYYIIEEVMKEADQKRIFIDLHHELDLIDGYIDGLENLNEQEEM